MSHKEEFNEAKKIAVTVGDYLFKQQNKKVESSLGRDIKLDLDKEAESQIISYLDSKFDHCFLSEEAGYIGEARFDKPYWIIDPIDGTANYSRDIPFACVSIALWKEKSPILGVVYDFYRKELFSGLVGSGAWLNNEKLNDHKKVALSSAVLATGFPTYMQFTDESLLNFIELVKNYKKIRMIGSAALSLSYVACGRVDTYIEKNIKIWDIAAGVAINEAIKGNIEINFMNQDTTFTKVGSF